MADKETGTTGATGIGEIGITGPTGPTEPKKEIKVENKENYDVIEIIEDGETTRKYWEYFRIFTDKGSYRLSRSQLDEISSKLETDKFVQLPDGTILATGRIEKIEMFEDEEE